MSGRLGRSLLLAAALWPGLAAAPALAQAGWSALYRHGLQLEGEGRWNQALRAFHKASQEHPRPQRQATAPDGTAIEGYDPYFHIARCLLELDRPGEAGVALLAAFRAGVTPRDEVEKLAERIREAGGRRARPMRPGERKARLSVTSDPPGAAVLVDGVPFGLTPTRAIPVLPGQHEIRVESEGYRAEERIVTVEEGKSVELEVALLPLPTPIMVPTRGPTAPAPNPITALAKPTIPAATIPSSPPATTANAAGPAAPSPVAAAAPTLQPLELPAGPRRHPLAGVVVLAVLVAAGATAWLIRRRRTSAPPATPTAPTRVQDAPTTMVGSGTSLGGYELLGTLGRGGMATTYRARRSRDGATVAIKLPHESCLEDPSFVTRFLREGSLGEQLHHPNIVRILDTGQDGERPFLAMEILAGRTLKQALRESGPLPVRRALEVARDVAEALDYAHAKGVVHRDLKPENIMLLPDGQVRVMDFGIARMSGSEGLTGTNVFLGTPLYAAPEMVDPKSVDHRIDLYALGIILFEMLEGTVPFTADSPYRVLEMHLHTPLPRPAELARPLPAPVWEVVTGLCEKDREKRTPSAQRLLVELHRLLRDFPLLEGQT